MGASESTGQGGLSHEILYEKTRNTRTIMNYILEYMLKEVTVKDFLALSNPTECKKYVMFMASTLHEQFYKLQLEPVRERGNFIAFRSIRDLAAPSAEQDREKQSLCLILAYYYTRIFQIYGALALTLIDDISTMRRTGIMTGGPSRGLITPGHRPMTYGGREPTVRGGALTQNDLGSFAFLWSFLLDEKKGGYGWRTKYVEQNGLDGEAFFAISSAGATPMDGAVSLAMPASRGSDKGVLTFGYYGGKHYAQMDLRVRRVSPPSSFSSLPSTLSSLYGGPPLSRSSLLEVTLENYRRVKPGDSTPTAETIPSTYLNKTLPRIRPIVTGNGQTAYSFVNDNRTINAVLQNVIYLLLRYTKGLDQGQRLNTPPTGSRTGYDMGYGTGTGTGNGKGPSAEILRSVSTAETGTVEPLRLGKILHNLQNAKPYGHCIARALQLLDTVPLPNQKAVSHICKAKFMEVSGASESGTTTRYSRSGIPEPDAALSTSPGLLALSQLFYDSIAAGTPKLEMSKISGPNGSSTLQQYGEFMRRMATYFGDIYIEKEGRKVERPIDSLIEKGIGGIKNLRDKTFCAQHGNQDIFIEPEVARQVYGVVQKLFQIQLEHSANCAKIFQMLFNIRRDSASGRVTITLHENVVRRGVPEINRINFIARDLLMKYYSRCEEGYMYGVKMVVDTEFAAKKRVMDAEKAKEEAIKRAEEQKRAAEQIQMARQKEMEMAKAAPAPLIPTQTAQQRVSQFLGQFPRQPQRPQRPQQVQPPQQPQQTQPVQQPQQPQQTQPVQQRRVQFKQ